MNICIHLNINTNSFQHYFLCLYYVTRIIMTLRGLPAKNSLKESLKSLQKMVYEQYYTNIEYINIIIVTRKSLLR